MQMFVILPEARECWNLCRSYLAGKDLVAKLYSHDVNSHYERESGLVALDYV